MRTAFALLGIAWLQFAMAEEAFAWLPVLNQVLPRGVQQGTEHKLTFTGVRLKDAEEIFFYDEGFEVVELKAINDKTVEVTVKVDRECRLGEHMVQVRTRTGVSGYRIIQVEAYPAVSEDEVANNHRASAQLIEPQHYSDKFPNGVGVVVAGRIENEDHDWFAFDGKTGERLSVEVVAMRLGDFCDTILELFDPSGKRIAIVDDTPFSTQDPLVSATLPADGRYLIHLTDAAGKGDKNAYYRMHVGNFPRPTTAVPAVAKRNELSEIAFFGDTFGPIKKSLQIDAAELYQDSIHVVDRFGSTPTPVSIRVVDPEFEVIGEMEPNDNLNKLERNFSLPFSVNGKIDSLKDRDFFRFDAVKNQRIRVETFGYRIGSTIDTIVRVRNAKSRVLGTNTDTNGLDSQLVVTIPADGSYVVEVENANRHSGATTRYQLDVRLEQPSFHFAIKEFARYTQQRQQVAVPAGNRFAIMLTAERNEFDEAFELNAEQLPKSIRMFARPMPSGATTMPVVFQAEPFKDQAGDNKQAGDNQNLKSDDSPSQNSQATHGQLIKLIGRQVIESNANSVATSTTPVTGHYLNRAQLMRVAPGNMCMKFGIVGKLAVARLEPVRFKVDLVSPKTPIFQSGRMNLQVKIDREEGFNQPIILRLPFRPPGIGAAPTIRVKPDQSTANYPINANNKSAIGSWPICVTAVAPNDQGAKISTGLHDLEIAAPFVSIKGSMVSTEVGSRVMAKCRIETLEQFSGRASVKLTQLPTGVTSQPQTFSAGDEIVQFPINVGRNCKTKKNHSVKVEVTIKKSNTPIVFDAGRLLMRFSTPSKSSGKTSRRQPVKAEKTSGGQQ